MILRRRIDTTIESRIITGMIVSKRFLADCVPVLDLSYFTNEYIRKVASWCKSFYQTYDNAPFHHIQDIFNRHSGSLKEEDVELITRLLSDISTRYQNGQGINEEYLLDQTLLYFKKRSLEITCSNISYLLDQNKIDDAESQIIGFSKIMRSQSTWINPFDSREIDEVFTNSDDEFLMMPDALGRFIGNIKRNWLVGVSGTFKKGKTWLLQEFAVQGILQRRNVAFFSLEMPSVSMKERLYKRLLGSGAEEEGEYIYPVFDCMKNQDGSCRKRERVNSIQLRNEEGVKPAFFDSLKYLPCNVCRGTYDFEIEYWWEKIRREAFTHQTVKKQMSALSKYFNKRLRIKAYPRFSANLSDINHDLDVLEKTENFVPDVIIVDYADILKPEIDGLSGIEKEDQTWMKLSQLAGKRHASVVTATQLRRSALDKKQVSQSDSALWIGKLAHVDIMLSMNQTPYEKECGVMRIGIMAHRYKEFSEEESCYLLQKLRFGQFNLDSELKSA